MTHPTAEGLRRYPHTQGYHPDVSAAETAPDTSLPCTCGPTCPPRCSGACGCAACAMAFTIFADAAGFLGVDPMSDEQEAGAIAHYEDV